MERDRSRARFGVGFAPILGADVRFSGLGRFQQSNPLFPIGGNQNYEYDNGFVRIDGSGNAGGSTTNWSYLSGDQYNPAGLGTLDFDLSRSLGNASVDDDQSMSPGIELFWELEMGRVPKMALGDRVPRWGFKATLQYVNLSVENCDSLFSDLGRFTDSFPLNGVIPPLAPFTGSAEGPNALLGGSPTRSESFLAKGAMVTGNRDFDADLFGVGLGAYLEYPVSDRFFLSAEVGVSLTLVSADYSFDSTTTIQGVGTQFQSGSSSDTSVLPGLFIGLKAQYDFSPQWAIYSSAKYQYLEDFEISAADTKAELSLNQSAIVSVGALFRF